MTPREQAQVFLAMLLCGAGMGAAYDLLSPLRRTAALCALSDLFFGVCCAAGIILTALCLRCEAFRLYTFAGMGCGLALYAATLGNLTRRIGRNVRKKIRNAEEKCKNRKRAAGI